jgi:ADP-ribose pyrophosphatase YjhB (NUDIX family)
LLFRYAWTPGESFWATPGGGLGDDETFEEAALREAAEELGVAVGRISFFWERVTDFRFIDQPIHQHETFFLFETNLRPSLIGVEGAHVREGILEARWWTPAEPEATSETVFPEDIVAKLKQILDERLTPPPATLRR